MRHATIILLAFLAAAAVSVPTRAEDAAAGTPDTLPPELRQLRPMELSEVVRKALEYSPTLKAQGAIVEQVSTNTKRAWAMLLPSLDVTGTYTLTDQEIKLDFMGQTFGDLFRLAMVNCGTWDTASMGPAPALCATDPSQMASDPIVIQKRHNFAASAQVAISLINLRTWPNLANVDTAIELTELQEKFTEEQLVFAVVQLYYGIATAQEAIKLMNDNVATAMRHMDLAEVRRKNGVALENERIRAAMGVVQARAALDQAVVAWKLARESLALLIGLPDAQFRAADTFATPWDEVPAAEDDVDGRRDIQMLGKARLMGERNVDDAWARFAPVVMGIWRWDISNNKGFAGNYDQWRAMVTLSWSIFDGGYRFADLDERRARLRELGYNLEQARIQARTEIARAQAEIEAAGLAIQSGEEMARLAEDNLRIVQQQYGLGAAPQTAVLDAEMAHTQARTGLITSRLRLAMAHVSMVKAAGKLAL
jgi:outer membrane protein TolC